MTWVHPAEARAGVEKGRRAGSTWSCVSGLRRRGQHAHQPIESRLRDLGLRVRLHRVLGRPSDRYHPPKAQDLPLLGPRVRDVRPRGQVERRFRSLPIGNRATAVGLPIPRVECQACGMMHQVEVPFADPQRIHTKAFERYALELSRCMTIRDVAPHLDVGWDIIKVSQARDLSRRSAKPKLKLQTPVRNAIRERCGVVTIWAVLLLVGWPASAVEKKTYPTIGTIERIDPRLDRLVPRDATIGTAGRGLRLVRGAGLGSGAAGTCSSPTSRRTPSSNGRRASRPSVFLKPERLHRHDPAAAASPARTAWCSTRRAGSSSASTATAASPGSSRTARFVTLADRYQGKRFNSPNDARLQVEWRPLLHRPALRPARAERRPGQGARLLRRLPPLEGRQADAADQGDDLPQRHRLLARREDALRRQLRPGEGDLDGLRRQGRRHARQGPRLLRRDRAGSRTARRACPTA